MEDETESEGHFTEEWLGSIVKANYGDQIQNPEAGLSKSMTFEGIGSTLQKILKKDGPLILGISYHEKYGDNTSILCKYLDSACLVNKKYSDLATYSKRHIS